jgi:uncharacterized protein (TIGR03083 family)
MNREENLERIRVERARFEAALNRLTPEQWLQPGACGSWTVRDVLGHIVFWEQDFLHNLELMRRGEPLYEITNDQVDATNDAAYQHYKDLPLDEMRAEFDRSHQQVVAWLTAAPQEELDRPFMYRRTVGEFVEYDTWGHYAEHMPDLEKFLG